MCNGFSSRASLGGAVANLRSIDDKTFSGCQLHFHNPVPRSLPTELSYTFTLPDCEIRIQSVDLLVSSVDARRLTRDSNLGDLTGGVKTAGKILFSVELAKAKAEGLTLDRRLELGVGGDGIIGRSVSVIRKGIVLGEGIVGWN